MKTSAIRQNRLITTAFLAIILFTFNSCWDNNANSATPTDQVAPSMIDEIEKNKRNKDEKFLVEAAEINMKEIMLSQLAQEKGTMPDIREMGDMMVTDHTKSLDELKALAAKKSIMIPVTSEKAMDAHHKLSTKSGADFDECYADMMVKGHEEAIMKFENAAQNCEDAEIRAWADKTLPDLRKHLEHAKHCQEMTKDQKDTYTSKHDH